MKRRNLWIGLALGALAVAALASIPFFSSPPARKARSPGLNIVVTIPPLAELASRLAPQGSTVKVLMLPGQSEHGYEFTPGDLAALAKADVVVYVGLGLEPQVEKFIGENPDDDRRDVCFAAAAGVSPALSETAQDAGHDHDTADHNHKGPDHDGHDHEAHDHRGVDPHLWLDPTLVRRLVPVLSGAMGAALKSTQQDSPAAVSALVDAEESLERDVDAIDREYQLALAPHNNASIVTHHNAWSRLAARYHLNVAAVLRPIESSEPTPGQLAAAVQAIKDRGVKAIFVEPQFDSQTARRIAESAGAKVLVLDPLGKGEWFTMMRGNLEALKQGL